MKKNTATLSPTEERPNTPQTMRTTLSHDDISQRARELWQKYGQPSGRDEEIWLEAETELTGGNRKSRAEMAAPGNFARAM